MSMSRRLQQFEKLVRLLTGGIGGIAAMASPCFAAIGLPRIEDLCTLVAFVAPFALLKAVYDHLFALRRRIDRMLVIMHLVNALGTLWIVIAIAALLQSGGGPVLRLLERFCGLVQ
jgi:hypothetical protein